MKTIKPLVMAGCAVACAAALAGCTPSNVSVTTAPAEHTVTVSASAEVKTTPDRARIGVTVETQAGTAEAAQSQNAGTIDAVIAALSALGVVEDDIQTSWSNLNPVYGDAPVGVLDDSLATADVATEDDFGGQAIVGYTMYTRLQVSGLTIEDAGAAAQAAVEAGATGTDGPSFYASDYDERYAEALEQATEAAYEKAQTLADAAGVSLGVVTSMQEGYQDTSMRFSDSVMAEEATDTGAAMKYAPGQVSITATVTASYAIL